MTWGFCVRHERTGDLLNAETRHGAVGLVGLLNRVSSGWSVEAVPHSATSPLTRVDAPRPLPHIERLHARLDLDRAPQHYIDAASPRAGGGRELEFRPTSGPAECEDCGAVKWSWRLRHHHGSPAVCRDCLEALRWVEFIRFDD